MVAKHFLIFIKKKEFAAPFPG